MINSIRGTYTAGLSGVNVAIDYNCAEARSFLDFLFADLRSNDRLSTSRRFEVIIVGNPARMSLWMGDRQLYFGESKHDLAYLLINEIIYDCIINSIEYHAVHAAAFAVENRGILFPGNSGSGKSSLAAWLTWKGYDYLTDELVLLSRNGHMHSFTRPISLKSSAFEALSQHASFCGEDILSGEKGVMIPHRCLNPDWNGASPVLDTIIYPEFIEGHSPTLTRLSSAQSCLKLMGCHVNARNIPDHGFADLANLTRHATSYDCKFGSFDDILPTLLPILFKRQ